MKVVHVQQVHSALMPLEQVLPLALLVEYAQAALTPLHAPMVNSAPPAQPILLKQLMKPEYAMPLNATLITLTAMP